MSSSGSHRRGTRKARSTNHIISAMQTHSRSAPNQGWKKNWVNQVPT